MILVPLAIAAAIVALIWYALVFTFYLCLGIASAVWWLCWGIPRAAYRALR